MTTSARISQFISAHRGFETEADCRYFWAQRDTIQNGLWLAIGAGCTQILIRLGMMWSLRRQRREDAVLERAAADLGVASMGQGGAAQAQGRYVELTVESVPEGQVVVASPQEANGHGSSRSRSSSSSSSASRAPTAGAGAAAAMAAGSGTATSTAARDQDPPVAVAAAAKRPIVAARARRVG